MVLLLSNFVPAFAQGEPFHSQNRKGKWGYRKPDGKWLVRPRYLYAYSASEGFLLVRDKHKEYLFLDESGKEAFEEAPRFVHARAFKNGFAACSKMISSGHYMYERFGFINTRGEQIAFSGYESVDDFDQYGFALCKKVGNNSQVIDTSGNIVLADIKAAFSYDNEGIREFRDEGYFYFSGPKRARITASYLEHFRIDVDFPQKATLASTKKTGFLDGQGQPITRFYTKIHSPNHGFMLLEDDGLFGLMDTNMVEVLPVQFKKIDFHDQFIALQSQAPIKSVMLLNYHLDTLLMPMEGFVQAKYGNLLEIRGLRGQFTYISPDGKIAAGPFRASEPAGEGMFKVGRPRPELSQKDDWGTDFAYMNAEGKLISPWFEKLSLDISSIDHSRSFWDDLGDFFVGFIKVISGVALIEFIFNHNRSTGYNAKENAFIGAKFVEGKVVIGKKGKLKSEWDGQMEYRYLNHQYGFMDTSGKVVVKPQYDLALDYSEGLAVVGKSEKFGYLNAQGKVQVPLIFNEASSFASGVAIVRSGSKYGCIDQKGKFIVPAKFEEINGFEAGTSNAKFNSKWGVIDSKGNWLIQPKYYHVGQCHNGIITVQETETSERVALPCPQVAK